MYFSPLNLFSIFLCFICSLHMVPSVSYFLLLLFLTCNFLLAFISTFYSFFHYFFYYFIFLSVCQFYAGFFFFIVCFILFCFLVWLSVLTCLYCCIYFYLLFCFHCSIDETLCQAKFLFKFSLNKRWAALESFQMELPKWTGPAQLSLDYIPW